MSTTIEHNTVAVIQNELAWEDATNAHLLLRRCAARVCDSRTFADLAATIARLKGVAGARRSILLDQSPEHPDPNAHKTFSRATKALAELDRELSRLSGLCAGGWRSFLQKRRKTERAELVIGTSE